jgi:hypothetical protein
MRTIRTEMTVQRESTTLLAVAVFDHCPLCGQKVVPLQEVHERAEEPSKNGITSEVRVT